MDNKKIPTLFEIECVLERTFKHPIAVPNISWGFGIHECDMLLVSSSGYATEIEIKRSKADLKKDASKGHGHNSDKIKYLYFAIPEQLENCTDLIPQRAGIILIKRIHKTNYAPEYTYAEIVRHPQENPKARKLTDAEILKVTKLGCLRIWKLKSTVTGLVNDLNYHRKLNIGQSVQVSDTTEAQ